ncbi:MAG TPA: DNA polymerase III subunit chi [Rhodomicrobium sp.]|nr:DNA polymerase III subunit chi [Rhodomicrobium sp.]
MTAPEFWFYHLERQPLQAVVPVLVEKALARGWRALLRFSTPERLETIDSALWTYRDESFLPHGSARDGHAERQPVLLTLDDANPNGAAALFLMEAAEEREPERFSRVMRLFEDGDAEAKALARAEWKRAKALGSEVSYWRQDGSGAWKKSA